MRETGRYGSLPSWPVLLGALALSAAGCTPLSEYIRNGFKVGPNYTRPPAPVAEHWIDADDVRVRSVPFDDSRWWTVFNDPVLNDLVCQAYQQNLTLREAGFRVLQARASLGIDIGGLFPQTQTMNGDWTRHWVSENVANRVATPERWFSQWDYGFNLAWELDFWGRFRRAIEAGRDELNASIENYDDVLVILLGDVATNYIQIRVLQQQIAYARQNVQIQRQILEVVTAKFKGGQTSELDVNQSQSDLARTEALLPQLEIQLREANNRLCVLLGIPAVKLTPKLGIAGIPTAPPQVAVGIPGDLLWRRPDVRRAEREAAAQCARIGVADAEFYPQISLDTTLGWSAQHLKDLFAHNSFRGVFGPSFQWEILNYFRVLNNVRLQDARFKELVVRYQNTVLKADEEVEDGLVSFLKSQEWARFAQQSADAEVKALREAIAQYRNGLVDFNRVSLIEERLVQRQTELAQAQGEIVLGLVHVYRALGGGWQIRCDPTACPCAAAEPPANGVPPAPVEHAPPPRPLPGPQTKAPVALAPAVPVKRPEPAPSAGASLP